MDRSDLKEIENPVEISAVEEFNKRLGDLLAGDSYISAKGYSFLVERFSETYNAFTTINEVGLLPAFCKQNNVKAEFINDFLIAFENLENIISAHNKKFIEAAVGNLAAVGEKTETANKRADTRKETAAAKENETAKTAETAADVPKTVINIAEMTAEDVLKAVLCACEKIDKVNHFGVATIVNVLRESKNKQVLNYKLNELDCYGALKQMKNEHVSDIVEFLITNNFLCRTQGLYPTIRINDEKSADELGKLDLSAVEEILAQYKTVKKPEAPRPANDDEPTIKIDGWDIIVDEDGTILTDMELLKRLQALRKRIGDENGVPYYRVAWDNVLVRLATKKPVTREEFLTLKGIKDKWFDKNGQAFLREIKDYLGE